jgi:hypothetical protein
MTRTTHRPIAATLLALSVSGCPAPATRGGPAPAAVPLPARVQGAHLRSVGDPRRGLGTRTARRTLERLRGLGANVVGVQLEGRMRSLASGEVAGPPAAAMEAARSGLLDANAAGLATVLAPHLYLDDGAWRGHLALEPGARRDAWWASYGAFVLRCARLAAETGVSALAIGVELKGLSSTDDGAARMRALAAEVRRVYPGPLTYGANWDEAEQVRFWDAVDLAGVQAYYPLLPDPVRGAEAVGRRLSALARASGRQVLVLEVGYRSGPLAHVRPWEWPEQVDAAVDDRAQSAAWAAVLGHWPEAEGVRGLLLWVVPTDPDDPASEPRHGFNPLNKPAEQVIGRAFGGAQASAPGSPR